jgi:hypothetical protein
MCRWEIVDIIDSFGLIWAIFSGAGQSKSSVIREPKTVYYRIKTQLKRAMQLISWYSVKVAHLFPTEA